MKFQVTPAVSGADLFDVLVKSAARESFSGRVGRVLFDGMPEELIVEMLKENSVTRVVQAVSGGNDVGVTSDAFDLRAVPQQDIELTMSPVADVNALYELHWNGTASDAVIAARLTNPESDSVCDDTIHVLCSYHALAIATAVTTRGLPAYRNVLGVDVSGVEQVFARTHDVVVRRWARYSKFVDFARMYGNAEAIERVFEIVLKLAAVHKERNDEIKARGRSALPTRRRFFVNELLRNLLMQNAETAELDRVRHNEECMRLMFNYVPTLAASAANDVVNFVRNVADSGEHPEYVNEFNDPAEAVWPLANYITELSLCLLEVQR